MVNVAYMPERLFLRELLLAELGYLQLAAGYCTVNGQHESHHVGNSQRSLAAALKESRGQSALCRQLVMD